MLYIYFVDRYCYPSPRQYMQAKLDELGIGKIASVSGRYYAMDRDNNWDREEKAYAAFVYGEGNHAANAQEAIEASYADDKTDEFVLPCVTCEGGRVQDGDTVIFMNFRPDRARQMTRIFCDDAFTGGHISGTQPEGATPRHLGVVDGLAEGV